MATLTSSTTSTSRGRGSKVGGSGGGVTGEYFQTFPISSSGDFKYSSRIEFMLNHPKISGKLKEWVKSSEAESTPAMKNPVGGGPPLPLPPSKDEDFSSQMRELGNSFYKKKPSTGLLLTSALEAYNLSLLYAPSSSSAFDSALANRSAVYSEMTRDLQMSSDDLQCCQLLQFALEDAKAAIASPAYPKSLAPKLAIRIAGILIKLKRFQEAREVLENFDFSSCDSNRLEEVSDLLKVTSEDGSHMEVEDIESGTYGSLTNGHSDNRDDFSSNSNADFENANPAIRLKFKEGKGRIVTCGVKQLTKGSLLFQETPYVSVLLPQFIPSHCSHCHVRLQHLHFFPCSVCTQVKYCSPSCASSAWTSYHKWECGSLDFLHSVGIAHLAIRVVLVAGLRRILRQDEIGPVSPEDSVKLFRCDESEEVDKGDVAYSRVASLVDHLSEMTEAEDLFQYALSASLLTLWLQKKTDFFPQEETKPTETSTVSKSVGIIGGAILKHICQLICNAHAITDLVYADDEFVNAAQMNGKPGMSTSTADSTQERIASAIYPSASMMNHSCDNNVVFGFVEGSKLVVRLSKDIPEGGEIFNCYGPHYRRMGVEDRQEILRDQYFFRCDCSRCAEEDPRKTKGGYSFVETFEGFKCPHCSQGTVNEKTGVCRNCRSQMNDEVFEETVERAKYADKIMEDAEVLLDRGKVKEALGMLEKCQKDREEFLHALHKDIGRGHDLIGKCYAILGNFEKSVEHVRRSLLYVGERFGRESFEFAREAKKLSQLLRKLDEIDNKKPKHSDEIQLLTQQFTQILSF